MFDTTRRRLMEAVGATGAASVAGCISGPTAAEQETQAQSTVNTASSKPAGGRIAADPTDIPEPIDRSSSKHHDITLTAEEITGEIESGVKFDFMTFDGQIPGPMIRVRQGDTLSFTLENLPTNNMPHNVDMHAIYGTGGGSVATTAGPGETNAEEFTAKYPGAFIYHCAVPNLDYHISSGMFGIILVEPKDGLQDVDHEFYFGQHEIYGNKADGKVQFDFNSMKREDPLYVLLNGEKFAYTANRHGPLEVNKGDTARVYMVTGGPNLPSYFHPIGNVWTKAWPNGALASTPDTYVQTMTVPPGSCFVGKMEFPVPERIKLVDHALSRVVRKGMMAEIDVKGEETTEIFDPSPDMKPSQDEEGPLY